MVPSISTPEPVSYTHLDQVFVGVDNTVATILEKAAEAEKK